MLGFLKQYYLILGSDKSGDGFATGSVNIFKPGGSGIGGGIGSGGSGIGCAGGSGCGPTGGQGGTGSFGTGGGIGSGIGAG